MLIMGHGNCATADQMVIAHLISCFRRHLWAIHKWSSVAKMQFGCISSNLVVTKIVLCVGLLNTWTSCKLSQLLLRSEETAWSTNSSRSLKHQNVSFWGSSWMIAADLKPTYLILPLWPFPHFHCILTVSSFRKIVIVLKQNWRNPTIHFYLCWHTCKTCIAF